jgi:hypothetical protein
MDLATDPIVLMPIAGAVFTTVAAILRRRHGPWALLAVTATCVVLTGFVLNRIFALVALFWTPIVPSILVAAAVLEWRARRSVHGTLWREVAWATAGFVVTLLAAGVVLQVGLRGMRLP